MAGDLTVFLCGDVMTGRGIDQLLEHPSDPRLREPYIDDARDYVALAERASGPLPRAVAARYVWGDALALLDRAAPDARVVNLETSITRSDDYWPRKEIHYRMHPRNVGSLTAARLDVCTLANNHVLDFGRRGLDETLATLDRVHLRHAGAGRTLTEARAPAVVDRGARGRLLVFACGSETSGVPAAWAASDDRSGVWWLPNLSHAAADEVGAAIARARRPGDVAIVSLHVGENWGYAVAPDEQRFARALVDAGADVVFGHSSHHPRPIEIYRGRLVLYGCGDFLNDYEGISGHEAFRPEIALMYFATVDGAGRLARLRMVPTRIRRFRANRASPDEARWIAEVLDRECARLGTRVALVEEGELELRF